MGMGGGAAGAFGNGAFGFGHPGVRFLAGVGDVFKFAISAGEVTAASMTLPSGFAVNLPLAAGVEYSRDGTDVLATRDLPSGFEEVRYRDSDDDGFYEQVGTARVLTAAPYVNVFGFTGREQLKVTLVNEAVTGVTQVLPNGAEYVRLSSTVVPPAFTWAREEHGLLIETQTLPNGSARWEVFRDGNADGLYTQVATGTGELVDLVGVLAMPNQVVAAL